MLGVPWGLSRVLLSVVSSSQSQKNARGLNQTTLEKIFEWDEHRLFALNLEFPVLGILNGLNVYRGNKQKKTNKKDYVEPWDGRVDMRDLTASGSAFCRVGGLCFFFFYWHILILTSFA